MRKLPVNQAQPGMVLAKVIENEKGMIICGAGAALSESLLQRLNLLNIAEIWVEGEDPLSENQLAKMKIELENRFSLAGSCPICLDLKEILLARLQERMS